MTSANPPQATVKTIFISGYILEEQSGLSLEDLCRACTAETVDIVELVHEGVLHPGGAGQLDWQFTGVHVHRAQRALRLQRDLGVNLAGAALALELMDEMELLRAQLQRMS